MVHLRVSADLNASLAGVGAVILAVRHSEYLELDPDEVVRAAGGAIAVVDCFGILDDDRIARYLELGCDVKGLGRGHIKRIKESLRKGDGAIPGGRGNVPRDRNIDPPARWLERALRCDLLVFLPLCSVALPHSHLTPLGTSGRAAAVTPYRAPHIAVVFATMDRAQTAVACVRALAAQTRPPEWVVVADNVSADETVAALEILNGLPFQLVVHPMAENRGNAGGVEEAMELAFGLGADAVWILDDDSWPRAEALAALLAGEWESAVVRHALQVDPATGRFTWPLQVSDGGDGWRLAWQEADLPQGARVRTKGMWTGALVPKEVRAVVGPVNGELFIRGEDEEYPWRIETAGFSFEAVREAVLDHPGPADLVHWRLAGKHLFFERGLADWKLYYKVRNMVWLKRRQAGGAAALKMALAYAVVAVVCDGPRRLPLLGQAIRDGWRGRVKAEKLKS